MAHPPFIEPQQTRSGGRCGEYRARTGWIESIEPRCIAQPDRDFRSHPPGGDDVAAAHLPLRLRYAERDGYDDRSHMLHGRTEERSVGQESVSMMHDRRSPDL